MKKVNCEEVKKGVHEYLHSELHEEELEEITAHLANCDSCESHYDIEVIFNQVIQRACDGGTSYGSTKRDPATRLICLG